MDIIIESSPIINNKFIIKKTDHPLLTNDFLVCRDIEGKTSCYAITKKIGEGGGGIVSLLQNRLGELAIMKKHKLENNIQINDIVREFECLKRMDLLINDSDSPSNDITLLKYIPGQNLSEFLERYATNSSFRLFKPALETKNLKIAIALVKALKEVFDSNIIHGDIYPQNILIQLHSKNQVKAKLIDFGLAQIEENPSKFQPVPFSEYYGAPELVAALKTHEKCTNKQYPYSEKSDIYSLGIILRDLGLNLPITKQMIHQDPFQRPNIDDVLHDLACKLNPDNKKTNDLTIQNAEYCLL